MEGKEKTNKQKKHLLQKNTVNKGTLENLHGESIHCVLITRTVAHTA